MNTRTLWGICMAVLLAIPSVSLAQVGTAENSAGGAGEGYVMPGKVYEAPYPGYPDYPGYEEAPYPGMPGNSGGSGGYIDWSPMWWNPLAESALGEPPGSYYYDGPAVQPPRWGGPIPPDGTVCTQDAMQCPDGTWVGRTGPNCEFVCGYEEAPYPGMPGNDGGYIDWSSMWWNPLAEDVSYQPAPSSWLGSFFGNFFNWLAF